MDQKPDKDLFISYSRRNKEFVQRLVEGIEARGVAAWVDWEDIPPSSDWRQEIYGAIETVNTFLFVVSPDSLQSEVCQEELAYAVQHKKRMLPVVFIDPKGTDLPDAVSSHNWVFARDNDDFTEAIEKIYAAYITDLDWVHMHTRILNRALGWEAKGRDASILFRGEELTEAEAWMAEAAQGKEPQPTQLQSEFVIASRQQATKNSRRLIAAVSTALVIAVILAGLAFTQFLRAEDNAQTAEAERNTAQIERNTAQTQEALAVVAEQTAVSAESTAVGEAQARATQQVRAEQNGRLSEARALALNAINALGTNPENSLKLAMYSFERLVSDNTMIPESFNALFRNFAPYTFSTVLPAQEGPVVSVLIDESRGQIITGNYVGEVTFYDLNSGEKLRTWHAANRSFQDDGSRFPIIHTMAASRDYSQLAIGTNEGQIFILILPDGEVIREMSVGQTYVSSVAFGRDGRSLLSTDWLGYATLWNLVDGSQIYRANLFDGREDYINDLDLSPDGTTFVTANQDKTVKSWNTADGSLNTFYINPRLNPEICNPCSHEFIVEDAVYSRDGTSLYSIGWDNSKLVRWDTATGEVLNQVLAHSTLPTDLALSGDGKILVSAGSDGVARVWHADDLGLAGELRGHTGPVEAVAVNQDGSIIVTTGQDGTVRIFKDRYVNEILRFGPGQETEPQAFFDPSGRYIVTFANFPALRLWDATTGRYLGTFKALDCFLEDGCSHQTRIINAAFSGAEAGLVASSGSDNDVKVWDVETRQLVHEFVVQPGGGGWISAVALSDDGRYLAATETSTGIVKVWDLETEAEIFAEVYIGKCEIGCESHYTSHDLVFSPDGKNLVTSTGEGSVTIFDLVAGERTDRRINFGMFLGYPYLALDSNYSPDGTRIVSAGSDGTARIWDSATGQVLYVLQGHIESVWSAEFSADDRFVVTSSLDHTVRFWDASSGQYLFTYEFPGWEVRGAHFSPDGTQVVVMVYNNDTYTGVVYVFDFDLNDLFPIVQQAIGDGAMAPNLCDFYLGTSSCSLDWDGLMGLIQN